MAKKSLDRYKVIKNIMEPGIFKELQALILDPDFTWFYRKGMTLNSTKDLGYFTHSFYDNHRVNSNHYDKYIVPFLNVLKVAAVIQIRANMFPSVFYKTATNWHKDYEHPSGKVAIFYLNDCDGGTELKINNKTHFIKAEANKILLFDSNTLHRGTTSKEVDFRYIINFNYFQNVI
mgnify:CR=1 FL=1|tara:strand:+ start:65 stop:592 length:528 start_codon:yes stop_codon:yes gene_type:complete